MEAPGTVLPQVGLIRRSIMFLNMIAPAVLSAPDHRGINRIVTAEILIGIAIAVLAYIVF
jgi:hypothetical protein